MKFKTTHYHFDLLKDIDSLSAFFEAIEDYGGNTDLAYDLGCGSGILSYFLNSHFHNTISLEIDRQAYECACGNLNSFENIEVINSDVLDYKNKKGLAEIPLTRPDFLEM